MVVRVTAHLSGPKPNNVIEHTQRSKKSDDGIKGKVRYVDTEDQVALGISTTIPLLAITDQVHHL
jgi:hypothetical protein